jgi:hypothetical protein
MISAASAICRGWCPHRASVLHPDELHVMLAAEECSLKNPAIRARYVDGGQRADRAVITVLASDRL